jgi:fructosamine-3-kinase
MGVETGAVGRLGWEETGWPDKGPDRIEEWRGMNVQEALLTDKVDPWLTDERLSAVASQALGERVSVSGYRVLTGGCWNRVIGVRAGEAELVFKISPHEEDGRIRREYRVLETFARETDMPVPEPLVLDDADGQLPGTALVMTRIPGEVMHECMGFLGREARSRILDEVAEHVTELHRRKGRGFGGVELSPEERYRQWPDFWLPRFDNVMDEAEASGSVPPELIAEAREVRTAFRPHLEIGEESTMTHYDVWSGNIMVDVDADPPRVSGYIDIPGFYADWARELSFAILFGVADRDFLARYGTVHELDEGFAMRANIYNLKMNIKHVEMYPMQQAYQDGAWENLKQIRSGLEMEERT